MAAVGTKLTISAEAIRNTRMRRGLSILELASKAGLGYKAIYKIEAGQRRTGCRMSTLRAIAQALDVEPEALMVEVADEGAA